LAEKIPSVVARIDDQADSLTEEDLDWAVPELIEHFTDRFRALSHLAYDAKPEDGDTPLNAFKREVEETVRRACEYYLFRSEHWRSESRSIGPYVIRCVTAYAKDVRAEVNANKRIHLPTCPACRLLGKQKWMIKLDGSGLLHCKLCDEKIEYLQTQEGKRTERMEYELRLRKIFVRHSRKGRRCPSCSRFIPDSYLAAYGISCPYDDCTWFGVTDELEPMSHPVGLCHESLLSLNDKPNTKKPLHADAEAQDFIADDQVDPFMSAQIAQQRQQELDLLTDVIDGLIERVKREKRSRAIKKLLMFKAYRSMVDRQPDDMIAYLVHQSYAGTIPIQSQIFQAYVRIVDNAIPFEIMPGRETFEVYSLQDENLDVFHGLSKYEAVVDDEGSVPNNTQEKHNGNRCFIGMVCDVVDDHGNSLVSKIDHYTFSYIRLAGVPAGTKVRVTHLRLPAHYEMGGLVQLQRVRKAIVERIKKRMS